MAEIENVLLLAGDALLYFAALAALLGARDRIGLGPFFCALGVLHFLETYLASIFYVTLPFGIVASPGSTVLFAGKLMLLLLLYIREDAVVVRQPIYGLLFGNVLVFALGFILRHHNVLPIAEGRSADFVFLDEMGGLMVWGTAILFLDCIIIILLYERTRAWFGGHVFVRLLLSSAAVLTFDQAAFFAGLNFLTGAGLPVLIGGWIAKMGAVALYSVLGTLYLTRYDRPLGRRAVPRLRDVFDTLTYRERYESLLARTGCDALTGALDRHSLEAYGRRAVDSAAAAGRPLSLLLIDLDHFKGFNDRFGHAAGDRLLRQVAHDIMAASRLSDFTYRFGGEEFVVIADGVGGADATEHAEHIRAAVAAARDPAGGQITVSIGVASCGRDATDYDDLFAVADRRLYEAKQSGRNRVIGPLTK
ncbi:MAG: GGDEF domain-containing protein [Proteobacteria bacterium]|nr:GGDEF domain-containing protein [Pseudomonadota bacterium]